MNFHIPGIIEQVLHFPDRVDVTLEEKREIALQKIKDKAEKRMIKHNRNVKKIVYKVNDLVLIKSRQRSSKINSEIKKFHETYEGPYRIIRVPHPNAVEVANVRTGVSKGVYSIIDIKRFIE